MSNIQQGARDFVRHLCDTCNKTGTSFDHKGTQFEARSLSRENSAEARYGLMDMSDIIGKGLVTVMDNGLDGMSWTFQNWVGGKTQSRATGGLGKRDCGLDPQIFDQVRHRKVLNTERIYIHREECALNFIGTVHQDNNENLAGTSVYFRSNNNLETAARSADIFLDLMMWDMASIALSIDGNSILGNWAGDNSGTMDKASMSSSLSQQVYPHFDGFIKQASLQANATYHASGTVTIPTIADGECIYVSSCTGASAFDTAEEAVTAINLMCRDIDGFAPYVAQLDDTTGVVTLFATELEKDIYGSNGLLIYVGSETDGIDGCASALPFTETQCKMQWSETPLLFDYNEKPTCDNWFDYWIPKFKAIATKCVQLDNAGTGIGTGRQYIAVDPLLMVEKDYANFYHMCKCDNALSQIDEAGRFTPELVPVQAMKGTGLWYWSMSDNLFYLTNSSDQTMGVVESGYDPKCQNIWQRIEILGNAIVADFNKFATNVMNSPFEKKLTAPYQPENLPHFTKQLRDDCVAPASCTYGSSTDPYLSACVHVVCPTSEGGDYTVFLDDDSQHGTKTVASYEWLLETFPTGEIAVGVDSANVEFAVSAAAVDTIGYVTLNVTYTDGTTATVNILKAKFMRDAC